MKIPKAVRREVWSYITVAIGCAISAVSISVFLVPNRIASGGVTGLAMVIHHWTGWPVGMIALAANLPLFLVGFRFIGSSFGIKTLCATLFLSIFIDLFAGIPPVTDDLLLAALAGGTVMGLGLGLVFRQDATTGGTDLAARIIHRSLPWLSVAQVLLGIDVLVLVAAAVAFRSYELPLYAAVALVLSTKLIDTVTVGINFTKAAHIISAKPDDVASRLLKELNRGVTGLNGRGLYTGDSKGVLVCVLTARQIPSLRRIVKESDPDAFVYISDAREVFGEGFRPHDQ